MKTIFLLALLLFSGCVARQWCDSEQHSRWLHQHNRKTGAVENIQKWDDTQNQWVGYQIHADDYSKFTNFEGRVFWYKKN